MSSMGVEEKQHTGNRKDASSNNWKSSRRRLTCGYHKFKKLINNCQRPNTSSMTLICARRHTFKRTHKNFSSATTDSYIFSLCLFIIFGCNVVLFVQAKSASFQDELRNVLASPPSPERRLAASYTDLDNYMNIDTRVKRFTENNERDMNTEDDYGSSGYPSTEELNEDWAYNNYEGNTYEDYGSILNDTALSSGIFKKLYRGPVCALIDVRNFPINLRDLENCTVVNGFVHILFMHNTKESDFEKYSFPKLRVITEYLLIYRVYGLRSIRKLFPNLTVIGGRKVFYKYGMVIYENPQLQELGLGNLRYIERGNVRIQKNNKLCYLDTVDWKRLGMLGNKVVNEAIANPVIKDNTIPGEETCLYQCGKEDECISSGTNGETQYCWGHEVCQKPSCPRECPNSCMETEKDQCQCHEECLAGCTAPHNASACLACRHYYHYGVCVEECPEGTFLENSWRCVTREWCQEIMWVRHDGKCLYRCPPDYKEVEDLNGNYCEYCGKECRLDCDRKNGYVLTDLESIKDIYRCRNIKGRLVINILADDDLFKFLELVLLGIEEVGALVIQRSESLFSLDLLRNLKKITGITEALVDETYCLYVLDNNNLRELFPSNDSLTPLKIENGKAFFHFNPRLCMKEIAKISKLTSEVEDSQDISETTNGDRATCDMMPLKIVGIENMPMGEGEFATARIKWQRVAISDPRTLIGYQVYYRESKYKNATRYEGLYACGKSSSWLVKDMLVSPREASLEVNESSITDAVLHNLKPFTQYAFYVRTYTTSTAQRGAQSDVYYFMTEPSKPTEPVDLTAHALNTTSIYVEWKPPILPNGIITHYIVRWRRQRENLDLIQSVDMCKGKPAAPSKPPKTINTQESLSTKAPSTDNNKECCSCDTKETLSSHEEEANNNLNFETFLHKKMFRVQYITMDPDYLSNDNKKKRSIYDDAMSRQRRDSSENSTSAATSLDILNNTESSTSTPDTTAVKEDTDYDWSLSVEVNTFITISNLHHFSEYEIQVFACNHASHQPNDITYEYLRAGIFSVREAGCGIDSIAAMRCQRQSSADVIPPESFKLAEVQLDDERTQPAFIWKAPSDPNGYVKFYTIEIQQKTEKEFKSADERCFSLDKFNLNHGIFMLPTTLAPGAYRGRVMAVTPAGKGAWTEFLNFEIPEAVGVSPDVREKYLWTVAIAAAVIIVLLILSSLYYLRKKKQVEARNGLVYSSANPEYVSLAASYVPDGYEVDEDDVDLLKLIGCGNFGKVFMGYAKKVIKGEENTQVAIKKLHEKSGIHKRIEFLEEAKLMKAFNSTHVVRLLGVVSQTIDPMVIMEYMENGDLKSHLRSRREDAEHESDNRLPPPTLQEKLEMAAEIADGMAYLAEIKYVHRDLAARNCLVSANGVVKIGDFGLTRDVYETDYYRKDSRGLLPIRWMAPESLRDGVFDSQSDVWSYGVVIWEIATLAEQPYQGRQHDHVTRYVIDGGYMEKPKDCPKKLYDLMLNCWEFSPEMRPKFTELLSLLVNDVTERFRQESFYYENKRAKLKPTDEEISLLNGDVIISREGSFRIATPITLTPSRSRSETPRGCHTPSSRNSDGCTKVRNELFSQCEHLKKTDTTPTSTSNSHTQNGKVGSLVHSASLGKLSRKGSANIPKSESFTQKLFGKLSPHSKKTPPDTLTHRDDNLYYSVSTSGIEDDIGDESTGEEMTSHLTNNDVKISNHNNKNTSQKTGNDITYATLSNSPVINPCTDIILNSNGVNNKPYAHMNGFVKHNNSQTKNTSSKRKPSRRTPVSDDESSYVESSPQHSGRSSYSDVTFHPMKVPLPPTGPPPFPTPNQPLLRS